ncbi:hypothetical protein ILYODFUR_037622 [Ilyodon furcidens]|uniref:Uncharacterized protein n=1 Tax=Ilyodon furcidens TaxID=33524 RepID=A0ABV0VB19_9TELE
MEEYATMETKEGPQDEDEVGIIYKNCPFCFVDDCRWWSSKELVAAEVTCTVNNVGLQIQYISSSSSLLFRQVEVKFGSYCVERQETMWLCYSLPYRLNM